MACRGRSRRRAGAGNCLNPNIIPHILTLAPLLSSLSPNQPPPTFLAKARQQTGPEELLEEGPQLQQLPLSSLGPGLQQLPSLCRRGQRGHRRRRGPRPGSRGLWSAERSPIRSCRGRGRQIFSIFDFPICIEIQLGAGVGLILIVFAFCFLMQSKKEFKIKGAGGLQRICRGPARRRESVWGRRAPRTHFHSERFRRRASRTFAKHGWHFGAGYQKVVVGWFC